MPMVGPITGTLAGIVDIFFLETMLPKSGVVAFLNPLI